MDVPSPTSRKCIVISLAAGVSFGVTAAAGCDSGAEIDSGFEVASPESASDSFPDEDMDVSDPVDSVNDESADCSGIFFVTVTADVDA